MPWVPNIAQAVGERQIAFCLATPGRGFSGVEFFRRAISGSKVSAAISPHCPSEKRQPPNSANGTAKNDPADALSAVSEM